MSLPTDSSSIAGGVVEELLRRGTVLAALVVSMLLFGSQLYTGRFPTPKPADAPASEFSAGRAADVLRELLVEGVPHPVGSVENRRVKRRIVDRLQGLGVLVEEQRAVGCHQRASRCAYVENVVARIPGREAGPAVLLMAHYDSVPMAPGAGDDGGGVATLLEVSRILAAEAPFRNPIVLVFTDGEEVGLLGAEAFFGQHPWAAEAGVVVNVEGSGSEGESLLLRTGPDSRWVVDAFRRSVDHPSAFSVADEVFKHMPNDTDFSVAQRAGLPGIDFAFAAERSHYHSPLDTVENLSLVTLQHHGENVLPLARELASMELTGHPRGDKLYHSLGQLFTISWNREANVPLLALALLLLAVAAVVVVRNGETSLGRVLVGASAALATFGAAVLMNLAVFKILALLNGTVAAWPAQEWPFRLCLVATTLAAGLAVTWALGRFLDFWSALLGAWLFYWLLAAASVAFFSVAANLFLIPTLGSALLSAVVACWRRLPLRRELLAVLTLALATLFTLKVAMLFEQSQGYRLIVSTFPFVALYVVALVPLLRDGWARPWKPLLASGGLLAVGIASAAALPLHSPWRPQPLNLWHLEDGDRNRAHWMIDSRNPVPSAMGELAAFESPEAPVLPWSDDTRRSVAVAPATGAPAPTVTLLESRELEEGRRLILRVQSMRGAQAFRLMAPASVGLRAAKLEGQSLEVDLRAGEEWHALDFIGVPEGGFDLELELATTEASEWYVFDRTSRLPASADPLLEARSPLAAPVHIGDLAIIFARVSVPASS
jgi:hypothetical protein